MASRLYPPFSKPKQPCNHQKQLKFFLWKRINWIELASIFARAAIPGQITDPQERSHVHSRR
jgi:hypothetical protein